MSNMDIVIRICKRTKGLTLNKFCEICNKYELTNEQQEEVQAELNGRKKHFDSKKLKIDLKEM